ncbi:MAG: N-acetyl-gamma-glutamyl-phosphate reductase, partial [Flammeovirgaceae bacterium]|nr:N-acetyl-gamma-glutamyl-phosphate reductase [Flammeovirgaceae bacterium]
KINKKIKIIDLSQDFRIRGNHSFVYGLPELNKTAIKGASRIANPGCFATTIQLGLLPLASEGLLGPIHTTAITGSTGAGRKLQNTTHFSWRSNNISAYKTHSHQHLAEINQSLKSLQTTFDGSLHFIPWRGDFTRGIFASSTIRFKGDLKSAYELYHYYYEDHPFTTVSESMINLKQVVNTNKCLVHLELINDHLVIHSATDNLLKGASGQAVQNMNLMLGLDETAGLRLKAVAY